MSAPSWLRLPQIMAAVAEKTDWIAAGLTRVEQAQLLLAEENALRPQTVILPALAEEWLVEYRERPGRSAGAQTVTPGRILVYDGTGDEARHLAALRRWLAQRAKEILGPRLAELATETGLPFHRLSVKNQRTRWGSCSATGTISLNCKLLFLPPELVRYVLLHELCHTREHNHTNRYWSLLRQHEPEAPALHQRMRAAWQQIPAWAHPVKNMGLGRTS